MPKGRVRVKQPAQKQNQERRVIPRPLSIPNVAIVHNTKLRFVSTAAASVAITYQNLLDTILVSTSTTLGYQLFDLVKVRAVEMWCYNPSGVATVSVAYVGRTAGAVGDDRAHTDTSMGFEPAYLKAVPNPKSLASTFQPSSTATAFNLYCPISTVIDLHLSFRTAMEATGPITAQQALVAATAGLVWFRGFDGLATAGTKFTPQGTPQII